MLAFHGLIGRFMVVVAILSVLALTGGAIAAPAAGTKNDGVVKFTGPKDEQWLVRAIHEELRLNTGPKKRQDLARRIESVATAWLATGRMENFDTGNALVHAMVACKYLAELEGQSDAANPQLAQWLLDHQEVRLPLFRALADVDSPEEALNQFAELQATEPEKVLEYPNLAVAFATAGTLRYYKKQPNAASMVESFKYYTDSKRRFRYDLKKMPYELSRYLADTRLSIAERDWATKKYFRMTDLGPVYFHVKYDDDHYLKKMPKKIEALDFTLPNLLKVGGVCIEQAYYASEVAKALGVPAAIVYGKGESGIGHAWFTYFQLNPASTSASWSGGAGRYQSQLYFTGDVYNPATGKRILDTELVLVGAAALLPQKRREQAESATALAKLVSDACREGDKDGDIQPLKALAADYQARTDKADDSAMPKVAMEWVTPKKKLDSEMMEKLLHLAVRKNIAYGQTWRMVVSLRKEERLSTKSLDSFFNLLISKTATAYPEQSCQMILDLLPTITESSKRDMAYKKSLAVYGRRPDLKGKILLAMGDDVRERGQVTRAIKVYQTAAMQCVIVPDVVLPAASKAEELLVANNRKSEAMRMYQALFAKTSRSDAASEIRRETSNYKLGAHLAKLLRQAGNTAGAERIMSSL